MTLVEFEQQIFAVTMRSSICDIPAVRRLTSTSISLRISIASGRLRRRILQRADRYHYCPSPL